MTKYTGIQMTIDAAWNCGYTARRFNDPITSNPWNITLHKAEYKAWRDGWEFRNSKPNPGDLA